MKQALILLVLASSLAGCASHASRTGEGSALIREAPRSVDPAIQELIPERERDRSRYWSVRDFMQPRGLMR